MPDSCLLVACLCAEWCSVCREYRSRFEQVGAKFPHARFVWVDVEDGAALVDPLEVEDFPTLLIAVGIEARFFGSLAPQAETLERLVRDRMADGTAPVAEHPDVAALLLKLRALA